MIDRDKAWKFAHEWLDAWNKHDVDLIMKHYDDSIEFCSPVVQKVLGDPKGIVTGIDNLRDYFSRQLKKFSTLYFQFLTDNGYFYLALKKGQGEQLENDTRYKGDIRKFWAYYEEEELKNILHQASFKILDFATIPKNSPYLNHDAFRVFCHKI